MLSESEHSNPTFLDELTMPASNIESLNRMSGIQEILLPLSTDSYQRRNFLTWNKTKLMTSAENLHSLRLTKYSCSSTTINNC